MKSKKDLIRHIPQQIVIAKYLKIPFKAIEVSPQKAKKFMIVLNDGTRIHYGAVVHGVPMSDFLEHQDEDRRRRFHNRFKNNKGYNNPMSGLFYSARLLW